MNGKRVKWLVVSSFIVCFIMSQTVMDQRMAYANTTDEQIHTVQSGDTLWSIAQEYKVEINELKQINQLENDLIHVGQEIKIPVYEVTGDRYIVQRGDNLWNLAAKFDVSIYTLMEANQLDMTQVLQIGQIIKIPTKEQTDGADDEEKEQDTQEDQQSESKRDSEQEDTVGHKEEDRYAVPQYTIEEKRRMYPNFKSVIEARDVQFNLNLDQNKSKEDTKKTSRKTNDNLDAASARVNHQDTTHVSKETLEWLSKIIEAEAEGEPYLGKVAVGGVIMNRVEHEWFPDSIKDVIFQRTSHVYQFSPVGNGRIYRVTPSEESIKAAHAALNGEDPTNGALYFFNPRISNDSWIRTRTEAVTIGQHRFAY
ncbi:cell wall hydrolase [Caldalkalibacillus salinus]|uniref:cell wall hydrolase n=1 Tax=Caldalkalibacillus salinus TaxID=2803787 RepID=UPI0019224A59|nr:cell wall hydrolase [Caldalkalibacillus salinus]